jgi:hypothetical protein
MLADRKDAWQRWVAVLLGLAIRRRAQRVFISYRSDGTVLAEDLAKRLAAEGFLVWRDEARDLDGEGNIEPGN